MKIIQIEMMLQNNGEHLIVGLGEDMFMYEYKSMKGEWVRMNDEHPFIFAPNPQT